MSFQSLRESSRRDEGRETPTELQPADEFLFCRYLAFHSWWNRVKISFAEGCMAAKIRTKDVFGKVNIISNVWTILSKSANTVLPVRWLTFDKIFQLWRVRVFSLSTPYGVAWFATQFRNRSSVIVMFLSAMIQYHDSNKGFIINNHIIKRYQTFIALYVHHKWTLWPLGFWHRTAYYFSYTLHHCRWVWIHATWSAQSSAPSTGLYIFSKQILNHKRFMQICELPMVYSLTPVSLEIRSLHPMVRGCRISISTKSFRLTVMLLP